MPLKPKTNAFLELGLLALLMALFLWWIYPSGAPADTTDTATSTIKKAPTFPEVTLEAKSAYVYDLFTHKVLFAKDAELQVPLASLTKVMTALTATTLLPEYAYVRIDPVDLAVEGDSGLYPQEEWKVRDLIDYSLIVSSNDGASALAAAAGGRIAVDATKDPRQIFVERMNTLAQEIGMHETYFINSSGLDVSATLSGGYGSAKDMTTLLAYTFEHYPTLLEATSFHTLSISSKTQLHNAVNTDKAIDLIPNVLASKTGFTDLSGGNLVVAFDAGVGHPVIISVLGSSYDGRFTDMQALVNASLQYLSQ